MSGELWSRNTAAEYLGIDPKSVHRVLKRRGHTPAGRLPGRGGESLWRADDIRDYADERHPWRGRASQAFPHRKFTKLRSNTVPHPKDTAPVLTAADHDRADVERLERLAATFVALGLYALAASVHAMVDNLRTRARATRPLPAPSGWSALAHLATLAINSPSVPHPGDLVRLRFPDRELTGTWMYSDLGEPYLIDDETGDVVDEFTGDGPDGQVPAGVEILHLAERPAGRDHHVAEAALMLRSAWTTPSPADVATDADYDPMQGCTGCGPDGGCAHATGCNCHRCWQNAYTSNRTCACGKRATFTVHAWSAVPQFAAAVGVAEQDAADAPRLMEPGESGKGFVCSALCARPWILGFRTRAQESGLTGDGMFYRLEPWTYTPSDRELPEVVARVRAAAKMLSTLATTGAAVWAGAVTDRTSIRAQALEPLHEYAAKLVDALAVMPRGAAARNLWPASPVPMAAATPAEFAELCPSLRRAVDTDPGRYQVSAKVVFDRVEQAYLCGTCDATAFTMSPNLAVPLKIGFGMRMTCPGCSIPLMP